MTPFHREFAESMTPKRLHLIILPTEACNFRCVYCYESFRLKRMEPSIVSGLKKLLDARAPTLGWLTLSWFGGEPLLAPDIMEDVLTDVARLRREHPSLGFSSDATTNASLLTLPLLERLVGLGVTDYQVTFDGPRRLHDRKRVRPGGAPTFDRIWSNLAACRASRADFHIQVRLHVDTENAEAMPEFFDEFQREFGGDSRYSLFIRGLSRLGGSNDATLPILEGEARTRVIDDLRRNASGRGIPLSPVPDGPGVCYAARGNSFVIRADGRVNKCTVALDHPANQVGTLLPDGSIRLRSDLMRPWIRGFESGDPGELACPMRGLAETARPAPVQGRAIPTSLPLSVGARGN